MTLPPDFDAAAELALAQELADLGNAVAMPLYESREFSLARKADRSEVTEADRNAELAISRRVLEARPHHGMYGEEHGVGQVAGVAPGDDGQAPAGQEDVGAAIQGAAAQADIP